MDGGHRGLFEREAPLALLEAATADAAAGQGRVVVVAGPAGIGKSTLLDQAAGLAEAAGMTRLAARGGQLEGNLAYGVVRQLFGPSSRAAGHARGVLLPDESNPVEQSAAWHALWWLAADLAGEQGLLVSVDDLQWADEPSQLWLAYLARRVADLPILLVAAVRQPDEGAGASAVQQLLLEPQALQVRPAPLGRESVAALVRRSFPDASERTCHACFEVTGGNPLLLEHLLQAVQAGGEDLDPQVVHEVGPQSVGRMISLQLATLKPEATELLRAMAVLGQGSTLREAAALGDLEDRAASTAAAALARAGLVTDTATPEFVHPIVRQAVLTQLAAAELAAAHGRAARLLWRAGASPERCALHLLHAEPAADPWAVEVLRQEASRALAEAAPGLAAAHLRRALAEPPPADQRARVLRDLGMAQVAASDVGAVATLQEAFREAPDPRLLAEVALTLGRTMAVAGLGDPLSVWEPAMEQVGTDPGARLLLAAEIAAWYQGRGAERAAQRVMDLIAGGVHDDTPEGRKALAVMAGHTIYSAGHVEEAAAFARRALAGGHLLDEDSWPPVIWGMAWDALVAAGHYDEAAAHCDQATARAEREGSPTLYSWAAGSAATLAWIRGRLDDALDGFKMAIAAAAGGHVWEMTYIVNAAALREAGDAEAAAVQLADIERMLRPDGPPDVFRPLYLIESGCQHLAARRYPEAVDDLVTGGTALVDAGVDTPQIIAWRPAAARALAGSGERERALALLAEERALGVRIGGVRTVGRALCAEGQVTGGPAGVALLEEAVRTLEGSGSELEHARALVALGAALRRANQRAEAKQPLLDGLELADRCGAHPLVAEARDELATLGTRPRRHRQTGVDALTPSERRVATLAAEGLTNRDIARRLFLSIKTVETHLGRAYAKLGVTGRPALREALQEP